MNGTKTETAEASFISGLRTWFTEPRKDALILFSACLIFSFVLIFQVFAPLKTLTGDEPHYMIVAHSVVSDGDFDLFDDYNLEKAWQKFYTGHELLPHYAPGIGGRYSTRPIGFGVFIIPFYMLGTAIGDPIVVLRIVMAILYALFMANCYLLCRDLGVSRKPSIIAWAFASFSIPLAFYSYSIYPEVLTGLLCVIAVRLMITWNERSFINPLLAGLCLSILPWLGLKYTAMTVVFGIGFVILIFRGKAALMRSLGFLALVPVLSALLYAAFLYGLYGTISPSAVYTGVGEGAKTTGVFNMQTYGVGENPVAAFLRTMLLYFLDQRDGIIFYSAFYLMGIAGIILLVKKVKLIRTMMIAFLAYWMVYAYSAWNSGHAPPGRPFVAVIWILILGLAVAFERCKGIVPQFVATVSAACSACFTLIFIAHNYLAYHVILKHTEAHGNNFLASITLPFDFTILFPNLFNPNDIHPVPSIIALTLSLTIIFLLIRSVKGGKTGKKAKAQQGWNSYLLIAAVIPVLFFALGFAAAELVDPEEMQGGGAVRLVFRDDQTYGYEPVEENGVLYPAFWQVGNSSARVNVVCAERPEKLIVRILSQKVQQVELKAEGATFEVNFETPRWQTIEVPGELAAPWMHRAIYRLTVKTADGYRPSEHGSTDTRFLGCRVAIQAIFPEK